MYGRLRTTCSRKYLVVFNLSCDYRRPPFVGLYPRPVFTAVEHGTDALFPPAATQQANLVDQR
jgi:hypothetical protein